MIFESIKFETEMPRSEEWPDNVFQYCNFKKISTDTSEMLGVFVGCKFEECDWYWTLFNLPIFVNVKFIKCTFRGVSFAGVRFIDCEFEGCVFTHDNLGGECSFLEISWYGCSDVGSTGLPTEAIRVDAS